MPEKPYKDFPLTPHSAGFWQTKPEYAYDNGLITHEVRCGSEFKPPECSEAREHRARKGQRMIEADQLRRMLDAADPVVKGMVLLGVNSGFNQDSADLPLGAVDLERGWIDFPRPKTGIERRCPLWDTTVDALRAAIAERPEPREKAAEGFVSVTTGGRPWLGRGRANRVSVAARDLIKQVGVHGAGIAFATLRRVVRTVAADPRGTLTWRGTFLCWKCARWYTTPRASAGNPGNGIGSAPRRGLAVRGPRRAAVWRTAAPGARSASYSGYSTKSSAVSDSPISFQVTTLTYPESPGSSAIVQMNWP